MKSHAEQLDDLQNQQQQLARQHALLKEQQIYLEGAPVELKIAVAHLEQARTDRERLTAEILNVKTSLKQAKTNLATYLSTAADSQQAADSQLVKQNAKLKLTQINIDEATKKLNSIHDESATRRRYLAEQEKIITQTIADAGDKISDLQVTYGQLERTVNSLKNQTITLQGEIETLILDKETLSQEVTLIDSQSELKIIEADKQLALIVSETEAAQVEYDQLKEAINTQRNELRAEVEAIVAKRSALFKESQDLQTEKRRFASAHEAFGIE